MRWLVLFALLTGCSEEPRICPPMFGQPNENTGLDTGICSPTCPCADEPTSPTVLDAIELDRLASTTLLDPPAPLASDPYAADPAPSVTPGMVCTVVADVAGSYRVASVPEADAGGALVTHTGACGLCSSLRDFSVYMGVTDLTGPVRSCAARDLSGGRDEVIACLDELGFSEPCASIWYYNAINTRTHCLTPCLEALEEPYHLPDGSLNPCLQCDEDNSGPVFKAVAGRTRRNSGLATALCRPCDTVSRIEHDYSAI